MSTHADFRQSSGAPRSRDDSQETLHPQSPPARARGKTNSASPLPPPVHTIRSDYSDAPPPRLASAPSHLSPATENPFAIHGRRSAHTAPAVHPANPPETQTADSWASAPATRPPHCTVTETRTYPPRSCS